MMFARELVGRSRECAEIDRLLSAARAGRSRALLIRGEAGIGKSRLLEYAELRGEGVPTLSTIGHEFDSRIPYSGLSELIRPVEHLIEALPESSAEALTRALSSGDGQLGPRFGPALALLGLLAEVARNGPLLVIVDDAQWVDEASRDALRFVASRIRAEGITMLIAERNVVATQFRGLPQLELGGLGEADVASLLETMGHPRADAVRLTGATAGNPLAVTELAGTVLAFPDEPTRTSEALRAAFLAQVAALPEETTRALLIVAASGPSDMPFIEQVLGALGSNIKHLGAAEERGIITFQRGEVEFRHPLLRSAVYYDASPAARRASHLAFAHAMAGSTVPAVAQRRVTHLDHGAAGPDEALASEFAAVGKQSATQAGFGVAADTLERAAMLSPDPERRSERYAAAAAYALSAGRLRDVERLLASCLDWSASEQIRIAVAHLGLRSMLWQGVPDSTYRRLAVDDVAARAPASEGAVILAEAALAHVIRGDRREAARVSAAAWRIASGEGPEVRMPVLLVRAMLAALDLRYAEALALLAEAEKHLASRPGEQWVLIAPFVRLLLDDLPAATRGVSRVVEVLRSHGVVDLLPTPLLMLARVHVLSGNVIEARISLEEAMTLVDSIGAQLALGGYFDSEREALLTEISALVGDSAKCRSHASAFLRLERSANSDLARCRARRAQGLLALATGDAADARNELRILDEDARALGLKDNPTLSWLADLAEAELLVGDAAAALEVQRRLSEQAQFTGTATARALCLLIRAWGADEPDGMVEAAQQLSLAERPFEAARARLAAGQVLRRQRRIRAARAQLRRALGAFEIMGTEAWRERAREELRACGVTVGSMTPANPNLTAQEFQVAQRAAAGASNTEIAVALFLSTKTVEFHLGNAYRKLGVKRRSQLAGSAPGLVVRAANA